MKTIDKKTGFTIIELLTVMSIIVILISLLVPSLNAVRRYSKVVRQKAQFHDIRTGLEMFRNDYDEYPDSGALDTNSQPYCGAMKLCEAMAGQDGLGFNPDSKFCFAGGPSVNFLYPPTQTQPWPQWYRDNLVARKQYLEVKDIDLHSIEELWGGSNNKNGKGVFDGNCPVLCDIFGTVAIQTGPKLGKRTGMPILYYKADTTKLSHNLSAPGDTTDDIYNYTDNQALLFLGVPGSTTITHPLYGTSTAPPGIGDKFLSVTKDPQAGSVSRPYNKETYILMSAGYDGVYGTRDDVYNFKE